MKKYQLLANVDIFQTVRKLCIEYFCSSCKFEIPVRSYSNQEKIISKQLLQNTPQRKPNY